MAITVASLMDQIKSVMAAYPAIQNERVMVHPLDARVLREAVGMVSPELPEWPDRILGFPVVYSDAVPRGQVLQLRPWSALDVYRWFKIEPAWLRKTKAQRRRAAKRFIREEVARRRMERCR
jgi:hypothetical protein